MRLKSSMVALAGVIMVVTFPAVSFAGPCADDIAALGRKLAELPSLGPATTGALSGASPGAVNTSSNPKATPDQTGTSADKAMGGTGGTKEMNAATAQVATSAEDVRRQQEGLPTAAQAASQNAKNSVETTPKQGAVDQPNDRASQAKMELEKARALDQKNDKACADAVKRGQSLSGS